MLLERAAEYGGTSAMAGGHFYLGGGTAVQKATGIEDSAEEMVKYLDGGEPGSRARTRSAAFCDDSVEHFDWIEALGMEFERSLYEQKAVIQPGTEGLMFTGNEKVHPFRDMAKPAPRGHKVPKPGDTGGAKIVLDCLAERMAETDVEVRYETGRNRAGHDDSADGARSSASPGAGTTRRGFIRAKAVVIAAGGYVGNDEMVAEYTPQLGSEAVPAGLDLRRRARASGSARPSAASCGSWTQAFTPRRSTRRPVWSPGIMVNKEGERFVAEDSYHSRTSAFVMDQPDQAAYLIVDSAHIEHPTSRSARSSTAGRPSRRWRPGSASRRGQARGDARAVQRARRAREDPEFHKHPDWLEPQDTGPWGAYDLTLGKAMYAGFTMGGMRDDASTARCVARTAR